MKKLWIIAGLLAGAGIAYYLYQEANCEKESKTDESTDSESASETSGNERQSDESSFTGNDDAFPLKIGSIGKRVERLQVWLLRNLGIGGNVDGKFDRITEKRLYRALGVKELDKETYLAYEMGRPVHEQKIIR